MSKYVEIVRSRSNPPKAAVILLAFVFAFGLFTMGFDQGHMFSIKIQQGADAFDFKYYISVTWKTCSMTQVV